MLRSLQERREAVVNELRAIKVSKEAGLIGGQSLGEALTAVVNLRRRGGVTAGVINSGRRFGDRTAIIDELGGVAYGDLDRRTNAIAHRWHELGLRAGDGVAVLARNHRGLPYAVYAAGKLGCRILLLNTDFAGPQVRAVIEREGVDLLVADEEYVAQLDGVAPRFGVFRAWADSPGEDTLEALATGGDTELPPVPAQHAKIVVLTSGTTGTPKGAPRSEVRGLTAVAAMLERIPFRSGGVTEMCAPMFHSLGFGYMLLMSGLGSTIVLRRRFDPVATLDSIERHRSTGMVLVPVMLQRMVSLGPDAFDSRDLSSLTAVLVSGSQLGSALATRALELFGPVVHNLYGSTEVAYATIATPGDLVEHPTTVGKVCLGARLRILDEQGREVPTGATGRVFVRNAIPFDGYTGGGHKEVIDGLMSSGDLGHLDADGRLFIDGRDDEMLVSGGENLFPREVEETLEHHPDVGDVACVGVPDDSFGERLRAFVVRRTGSTVTEDELRAYVKENLAGFKVPREVVFLDELPRTATGKVLKRELRG
ncbi:MAG TPA: AMP-binding protein [Marmoricola sp.]|nr:AMP-binding protein [Marmoricola sp.]